MKMKIISITVALLFAASAFVIFSNSPANTAEGGGPRTTG